LLGFEAAPFQLFSQDATNFHSNPNFDPTISKQQIFPSPKKI
jgi:hypothetical protein